MRKFLDIAEMPLDDASEVERTITLGSSRPSDYR
jgi:hypothetical protein